MLLFLVFVEKKVAVAIIELAPVPGHKKRINGMVGFFKLFDCKFAYHLMRRDLLSAGV